MDPISIPTSTFATSGAFDPSNIGDVTFSTEDAELAQNLAQNAQWQMPDTTARSSSDNSSCMADFLSILKVVLPAVVPLM